MAGNIKQAYIDSSLSYYHDLIARGVDLENIKIHIQSGAEHNEEAWAENLPDCFRFFAEKWDQSLLTQIILINLGKGI